MARVNAHPRSSSLIAAIKASDPEFKPKATSRAREVAESEYQNMTPEEFSAHTQESAAFFARMYLARVAQREAFAREVAYHASPEYRATTRGMHDPERVSFLDPNACNRAA